jgi:hypothetical protein
MESLCVIPGERQSRTVNSAGKAAFLEGHWLIFLQRPNYLSGPGSSASKATFVMIIGLDAAIMH